MRPILQSQSTECSLACLAMVASSHGLHLGLAELRQRFPVSLKGATLHQLISCAGELGFNARPVRLDPAELAALTLPCILHWDLNHFVVLQRLRRRSVQVLDPAVGARQLSWVELGRHFTGVALELTPGADFQTGPPAPRLRLAQLTGRVQGLRVALLQIVAVAVVLELFALLGPLFNQLVVDEAIGAGDADLLTVLVLGFGLLLVVQTAVALARSWMVMVLGQTLALQWMGNVFAHLVRLPVAYFEQRHLGDVISRFGSVGAIQRTLTTAAIEALLDGLMATAALVVMLVYAPGLSVVCILAVLAYGLLRWASYGPFRAAAAERLVMAAKESSHFIETLRAITPLKLFGREEARRARWQNLLVDVQNRDVRTAKMNIAFTTASTMIFGIENLLVFWLGAQLVMSTQTGAGPAFTIGMLFAFVSYKQQFSGRVSALINHAVELKMLGLHSERLADIALSAPERDAPEGNLPQRDLGHLPPSLELRGVSFRYGAGEPWVLREVDLRIEAGQCVALTGPSGAGKTTLMKLLLGILQPAEGEVLYGGVPLRQLGLANVRRCVATVMQEDVLLSGSLADNISFFDAEPDARRLEACAALARVHEDIVRMPMGYHTLVGDLGSGLSGGQRQRLLLARALYKGPRALLLDEATSHLDLPNERAVGETLAQLALTRLVIAHRPETLASAGRVLHLQGGRLSEAAGPAQAPSQCGGQPPPRPGAACASPA